MDRRKRRRLNRIDHEEKEKESSELMQPRKLYESQRLLRHIACQKLHSARDVPIIGNQEETRKVYDLLDKTVKAGESDSMLLIGPRGSGKTKAVEDGIRALLEGSSEAFHTVKLNALIQRDDKIALREIMRQLGKQLTDDEDAEEQAKNYSDTLTKLIATLSSSQTGAGNPITQDSNQEVAKSVIFVLDEFDLFALHPRQTLLYNLFDIAQTSSRQTPIVVLGLTTKVNVVEMLEKRVKSRFSHRSVYFKPADGYIFWQEKCLSALQVTRGELDIVETATLKTRGDVDDELEVWNQTMKDLIMQEDVARNLTYEYYASKSLPDALSYLSSVLMLLQYDDDGRLIVANETGDHHNLFSAPGNKLHLVPQLPQLAFSLLICAARLELVHCSDLVNFNMAYDEYTSMLSKTKYANAATNGGGVVSRSWSSDMSLSMWNHLVECELLIPNTGSGLGKRVVERTEMCKIDVALEEIRDFVPGIDPQLKDWCKI